MRFLIKQEKQYNDDGDYLGTETIKTPICHFTPMTSESYPFDDAYGEASWGLMYRCKHCSCQIIHTKYGWEKLEDYEKESY